MAAENETKNRRKEAATRARVAHGSGLPKEVIIEFIDESV